MSGELVKAILELHREVVPDWVPLQYRDTGITVCEHCYSLCHSYEGLRCDDPTDGLYPCETVKLLRLGTEVPK